MFWDSRKRKNNCAPSTNYGIFVISGGISGFYRLLKEAEREGAGMAVELKDLYAYVQSEYDLQLLTTSCFGKKIGWVHMVEEKEFAPLLHGDELVFNSGLNYTSEEWVKGFIDSLLSVHAGGLIISSHKGRTVSKDTIEYCNQKHFPLFSSSWNTPYIDVMRKFSEILLKNEQRETNLITALKNAIYYPEEEGLYLKHFEHNGFFRDMSYTVIILSCFTYDTERGNERLKQIENTLRYVLHKSVIYEEKGRLIILAAGYLTTRLQKEFGKICREDSNIYAGIGTTERRIADIHNSYENAYTAYRLTKTTIPKNLLYYNELGIYKLLADVKEPSIYPAFVEETLGALIAYDKKKNTEYMRILETFFENDCCILQTSKALYCHKNTLNYKMNAIKEILDYDIMCNENRVRIMMSFYILKLGADYF